MKRIKMNVVGVPPTDRLLFCDIILKHLAKDLQIEPVFDKCDEGDERAVLVDCCEFTFSRIRIAIEAAFEASTCYVARPRPIVKPMHDPAKAIAA